MSVIGYGAIAFKNGKCIQDEIFMDMKSSVGWTDKKWDYYQDSIILADNCFSYIGDEFCTLGFYKTCLYISYKYQKDGHYWQTTQSFGHEHFKKWKFWSAYFSVDQDTAHIYVYKKNGYYLCKMNYKGDKYKVYFGHGVDLKYYNRTSRVNYYRSWRFLSRKHIDKLKTWGYFLF